MPAKTLLIACGTLGSCAAVSLPVSVHEFRQLSSIGGPDGANATILSSLSSFSGAPNTQSRKKVCEELGGTSTSSSQVSHSTSSEWTYSCDNSGGGDNSQSQNGPLQEKNESKGYTGSLTGHNTQVRCLRSIVQGNQDNNTVVDGSQCRKK